MLVRGASRFPNILGIGTSIVPGAVRSFRVASTWTSGPIAPTPTSQDRISSLGTTVMPTDVPTPAIPTVSIPGRPAVAVGMVGDEIGTFISMIPANLLVGPRTDITEVTIVRIEGGTF